MLFLSKFSLNTMLLLVNTTWLLASHFTQLSTGFSFYIFFSVHHCRIQATCIYNIGIHSQNFTLLWYWLMQKQQTDNM